MTPCDAEGNPDFDALVATGQELIDAGMDSVVYCGSMGDWPLLTDEQRQIGVKALVDAGIKVIVGTGAQNTKIAAEHAAHALEVGAHGLMVIPLGEWESSPPMVSGLLIHRNIRGSFRHNIRDSLYRIIRMPSPVSCPRSLHPMDGPILPTA